MLEPIGLDIYALANWTEPKAFFDTEANWHILTIKLSCHQKQANNIQTACWEWFPLCANFQCMPENYFQAR